MKKQNGITLIALIITIIVMLILVGVSVTVALNGGLFTTAKQASSKTELESEKERLLEIVMGALNDKGKVDSDKLETAINASEDFEMVDKEEQISKGLKTGTLYKVGQYGSVTVKEGEDTHTCDGCGTIACTICGEIGECDYWDSDYVDEHYCYQCSKSEEHKWDSDGYTHTCTVCEYSESCDGCSESACYFCGEYSTCIMNDEHCCEICGNELECEYNNDADDEEMHECWCCGDRKEHEWNSEGVCTVCGYNSNEE